MKKNIIALILVCTMMFTTSTSVVFSESPKNTECVETKKSQVIISEKSTKFDQYIENMEQIDTFEVKEIEKEKLISKDFAQDKGAEISEYGEKIKGTYNVNSDVAVFSDKEGKVSIINKKTGEYVKIIIIDENSVIVEMMEKKEGKDYI